ncbi:DUF4913 domain-containing protein [Streptomyces microflavus]
MSDTPTVDGLFEDVEDLKANVTAFAEQLQLNTEQLKRLAAVVSAVTSDDDQDDDGESGKEKKEKPKAPPFILWLPGDQYGAELAALAAWVENLLVPTYFGEVSSSAPWCAQWWEHPAAVARLHAVWLAWQELTNPETCGHSGPSVWHRDHLDPMLSQLRSASGPFAGCMTNPDRRQHSVLPVPPVDAPHAPPVVTGANASP